MSSDHDDTTNPADAGRHESVVDCSGIDRRATSRDGDSGTNLERRRGVGRRLASSVRPRRAR